MRNRNWTVDELECKVCGTKMFVPRKIGQRRSKGHIKTFWCPKCKRNTDHIEIWV